MSVAFSGIVAEKRFVMFLRCGSVYGNAVRMTPVGLEEEAPRHVIKFHRITPENQRLGLEGDTCCDAVCRSPRRGLRSAKHRSYSLELGSLSEMPWMPALLRTACSERRRASAMRFSGTPS